MELWMVEKHTPGYSVNWRLTRTLHREQTPFQQLAVLDTVELGRVLVLDGNIQVTELDEFIYHEMIAHVPLFTHPHPQEVLVIGGGDGGTVREVLKHPRTRVDLVEIDERVIAASKQYLPQMGSALDDPRATVIIADGIKYIEQCRKQYDLVIIDSSDPIGPAVGLFREEFYRGVHRVLKDDGMMVAQTESPIFNRDLLAEINRTLRKIFPLVRVYLTSMPSYIAGPWSFTLASKKYDPAGEIRQEDRGFSSRCYTPEVHRAALVLPPYVRSILSE
ncbi:MAG: polyamine aminopropyltransferase [Syntrophomonadaceae bacterium]|nr:polyamine aminopropyltransferase [Syntrophomonadaceae bacterium]